LFDDRPVLWQAWESIVRALAETPQRTVASIVEESGWGTEPEGWPEYLAGVAAAATAKAYSRDHERTLRLATGMAMEQLRGKVPAEVAIAGLEAHLGGRP